MFDFLSKKFSDIFTRITGADKLTEHNVESALEKVHDALLEADVPYDVVQSFISEVKKEVVGQKVYASLKPQELLMKIVHDKVVTFLGGQTSQTQFTFDIPSVVMVLGLQGSGKTTTTAKLAYFIKEQATKRGKSRRIMLASVDFYRPAAIDQLEILAQQTDVLFYRSSYTDPIAAAQDIYKQAQAQSIDILLLDTAGRLHVDTAMLEELKQIDSRIKPKYKLLVIDAMTGQESLKVAQAFEEKIGFSGSILTKMDSNTRGGLAFAFKYALKKPILFIATGEKVQDLELFRPERIASRIIGMGDIASLVEKAQEKIKQHDQDALYKSISQGKMNLADFAQQIEMVNKLGSLSSIMKYMPNMGSLNITPDMLQKGEVEIKKFKAIISSMTKKERIMPKILDTSRKNRIAKGAGVSVADINALLTRFEQSQQFAKVFSKMGKFKGF